METLTIRLGRVANGPDPPFRNGGPGTQPHKELRLAGVVAEGKGNMEWVVDEGSYKYHHSHVTSFKRGD